MKPKKIAVFISGRGSNFKAIATEVKRGKINAVIDVVVSDNSNAAGLKYAHEQGIECAIFEKEKEQSRSDYFAEILKFLKRRDIDLIVLAGFMKVLSNNILEEYRNRIINIHPALLPSFPGVHAQKNALEYGVRYSGCTVHFIDQGVDTGPIILQEVVPVYDDDTEDTLSARILEKEHTIYPCAVKLFCEDCLIIKERRVFIKQPQQ